MDQLVEVGPAYGSASLADVLPSALAALAGTEPGGLAALAAAGPRGGGADRWPDPLGLAAGPLAGVRKIALLLVDGLGWHQLPLAARRGPTLADVVAGRLGTVRTLTAGFPSTTPTSLVTLGTGAAPGAHGILGFTLRVPGTGTVLNHIRWGAEPDPAVWQPVRTRFAVGVEAGVSLSVVSRPQYAGSGLTVAAYRGARYVPAADPDTLATTMLATLRAAPAPALVYGYHPDLDHTGHVYGVDSDRWLAEAEVVDRLVARLVDGLPPDAALLVTADHGQLDVPAEERIDCDGVPALLAGVEAVAGEPRVRYLHTVPGARDDVLAAWRGVLGDTATVVAREQAVAAGWFGPVPEQHLLRVGDVVVACRGRRAVVATEREPRAVADLIAYHGSMTAAEMEIPLLIVGSVAGRG